jgi:hypothetical protein
LALLCPSLTTLTAEEKRGIYKIVLGKLREWDASSPDAVAKFTEDIASQSTVLEGSSNVSEAFFTFLGSAVFTKAMGEAPNTDRERAISNDIGKQVTAHFIKWFVVP